MTPVDDIIGPVIEALAAELSSIVGVGRMYLEPPDGPPEDNSVLFPLSHFKFEGDTNGKIYVRLGFRITYVVRRSKFPDNIQQCYLMFSSFSKILSSLQNQDLGNLSITVTPKDGSVGQFGQSMQAFVVLILNTEVLTEFNILT